MVKIVFDARYGGFSLSDEGYALFRILGGVAKDAWDFPVNNRHNPILVKVVETMGKKSWGEGSELRITEVAPGTPYRIKAHDGKETVKTLEVSHEWTIAL